MHKANKTTTAAGSIGKPNKVKKQLLFNTLGDNKQTLKNVITAVVNLQNEDMVKKSNCSARLQDETMAEQQETTTAESQFLSASPSKKPQLSLVINNDKQATMDSEEPKTPDNQPIVNPYGNLYAPVRQVNAVRSMTRVLTATRFIRPMLLDDTCDGH